MVILLKSSAAPRHRDTRGDIVIDLFLRRGMVWREISRRRDRWVITPREEVPPLLPPEISSMTPAVYAPASWPATLQSRHDGRLEDVRHDGLFPAPWLNERPEWEGRWPHRLCEWEAHCRYEWWSDLRELHDAIVPRDAQRDGFDGFKRVAHWMPFLSACLVFDPPPKDLLGFRAAPAMVYDLPPNRNYAKDGSDLLDDTPIMFTPPIAHPTAVSDQPVVLLEAATQDATNTAKLLTHGHRSGRVKSRDRLEAVQCAVWRDQCSWSHRDIAERMGWRLRADEYGSHRISDRVQDHIKEGRAIIDSVRK